MAEKELHNTLVRELWNKKADFWDEMMGDEGNAFHRTLVSPAMEKLLAIRPGMHVLDVACGSGVFARRLVQLGATVTATDFSPDMIICAKARGIEGITYNVVDAIDEQALLELGEGRFDAITCNMALMDMIVIEPLLRATRRLLKPEGCFAFSIMHPCFNHAFTRLSLEEEDRAGELVETYMVAISNYLHIPPQQGAGAPDEPTPHFYFHRPLHELLNTAFEAGFVLDGMEERAFEDASQARRALSWAHFKHIPPIMVARLRPKP